MLPEYKLIHDFESFSSQKENTSRKLDKSLHDMNNAQLMYWTVGHAYTLAMT